MGPTATANGRSASSVAIDEPTPRLRMQGYEPDNLVAKDVKAMIDVVAREKRLIAGKPKAEGDDHGH